MLSTLFILSVVSGALCIRDDGYYGPQTFQNQNDNRQSTQYSEPVSQDFVHNLTLLDGYELYNIL